MRSCSIDEAVKRTQDIIDGAQDRCERISSSCPTAARSPRPRMRPTSTEHTDCVGFVGASSLERLAVEESLIDLTQRFKKIPVPAAKLFLGPLKSRKAGPKRSR